KRADARHAQVSGVNPISVPAPFPLDQLSPAELGNPAAKNLGTDLEYPESRNVSLSTQRSPPVLSKAGSTKSAPDGISAQAGKKASTQAAQAAPVLDLAEAYRNSWLSPEQLALRVVDALNSQDPLTEQSARQLLATLLDEHLLLALVDFQGRTPQPRLESALMSLVEESRIPLMARILSRTSGQGRSLVLLNMLQKHFDHLRGSQKSLDPLQIFRPSLSRMKSATFRPAISARAADLLDQLGHERAALEKDSPSN
ncbi:MAG: hypothetical protein WCH11_05040, partial [Bdellovibrio sp.]